ncbi:hypothetical protein BBP40_004940, partial [Aspergillus hancockii]
MEPIAAQVQQLAARADDVGRQQIIVALRNLSYSLESPDDTMQRIMHYHLQIASVCVGVDLKLFDKLSEGLTPLTAEELSRKTRYFSLVFTTIFQDAWKTDNTAFEFFPKIPKQWDYFNAYMAARRAGMPTWLSVYPVEDEARGWNPEDPLFVDIGGGIGHQCKELQARYPQVSCRLVLEDLPYCTENALAVPGLEVIPHDFNEPQPVKGAKFYYMRGILHDWPDETCRRILNHTVDALGPESVILIDDMVLPATGVNWQTTQVDLCMMMAMAGRERTHEDWSALLDIVGLKIVNIH